KLGKGGIREIEFIAQALQLAYGGRDRWLRASHTLISLARLGDRKQITDKELSQLFDAYDFLRRLEHILQMENGLQTHLVPNDPIRRALIARRMRFDTMPDLEAAIQKHTANVSGVFLRIFSDINIAGDEMKTSISFPVAAEELHITSEYENIEDEIAAFSTRFAEMTSADPTLIKSIPNLEDTFPEVDHLPIIKSNVFAFADFRERIAELRKAWSRQMIGIIAFDAAGKLPLKESKRRQTLLAEASISVAIDIARREMETRYGLPIDSLDLAIMGLGKLGGAGIDYDSDLDLVLVYDDTKAINTSGITHAEYYARAAEIFVTILSSMTREGSLYRVDLRLRPHGKNGPSVISRRSFLEYMENSSAVWELLAFIKIRAAGGDPELGSSIESAITGIILKRASLIPLDELASETKRVRQALENEKVAANRSGEIDIKYGAGGMLDIYFAIRFLQLRDNISDDEKSRSTDHTLSKLFANGSLPESDYQNLLAGYEFLSDLDHNIRLAIGRSTRLPIANQTALRNIAKRMNLDSVDNLLEQLTVHRLNIRASYDNVIRNSL
ncbi:MAG TPA: hypothetical protein VK612_01695, partial [Pyrinomonadaceae bacterium]|nr:hypothetical protein [Pyrinomonadaceae bacterium]